MRAVVLDQFGSFEDGRIAEIDRPEPKPNEILIKVAAAPINYVDLVVAAGKYQFPPPLPYTPGKGPAGTVVEVGSRVEGFSIGDRVLAMAETGGYAEYAVAPAADCYLIPNGLSFSKAGAMSLAYDTAWCALRERGRVTAGETILVLGATGAVGRACMQLGRALGTTVIAGVSSPARAEGALAAGANHVVDLSVSNLHDEFRSQIFEVTEGRGADVVIDMLGGDIFDAAIRAVAWRGRLVVVGFASGRIPTLKVNYVMLKNIEVSGLQVSDYRKRTPQILAECYKEIFALFEAGLLDFGGAIELPLSEFKAGTAMVANRSTIDRIVLVP